MGLYQREADTFVRTYKRLPLEIVKAEGMHAYASDGRKYLDMFSGLAVNALGNAHPRVVSAITAQASRYLHLSNYFLQEPQIRLAELLARQSGFPRVFFCNSGTEAVEGAIKFARKWGSTRAKKTIISISNAFHGRTMGALSIMDKEKYKRGFEPFLDYCKTVGLNSSAELRAACSSDTLAVVLEFIQGEGGIRPVSPEFAQTIAELQKQHGFLLIADEIQSGVGRTGRFFGYQHFGAVPDIVTVAKPIGGGLPLGAILATDDVAAVIEPGMHGTTFGGNPVSCAAGIAVLEEIEEKNLMAHTAAMGTLLISGLASLKNEFPKLVKEVRGYGLMVGAELFSDAEPVVIAMREKGFLINGTDQTVLRFLPPLIVTSEQIDETIAALREVLGR